MKLLDAIKPYQPTLDITRNPGCGKLLSSKEARLAHNRKLAELYFLNFMEYQKRGRNYGWKEWKCQTEDCTVTLGSVDRTGTPLTMRELEHALIEDSKANTDEQRAAAQEGALNPEQLAYLNAFESFASVPNSLIVVPFEEGAYFRLIYDGVSKQDGRHYPIWEVNLILVNDHGMITHHEMWDDTLAQDEANRQVLGISLRDMDGLVGYAKALIKRLRELGSPGTGGAGKAHLE